VLGRWSPSAHTVADRCGRTASRVRNDNGRSRRVRQDAKVTRLNSCISCSKPHSRTIRGKPAVECDDCASARAAEMASLRRARLAAGKCARCGAPRDETQLCKRCRKNHNRRRKVWRAKQKDTTVNYSLAGKTPAGLLVDQPGRVFTPAEQ
jgi:hypothetical protein